MFAAKTIAEDGADVGFGFFDAEGGEEFGLAINFMEAADCFLVLLAELGVQIVGAAEGAENGEDLVEVFVGEGAGGFVVAQGAHVKGMPVFFFFNRR